MHYSYRRDGCCDGQHQTQHDGWTLQPHPDHVVKQAGRRRTALLNTKRGLSGEMALEHGCPPEYQKASLVPTSSGPSIHQHHQILPQKIHPSALSNCYRPIASPDFYEKGIMAC
jgi:hypothetical protein